MAALSIKNQNDDTYLLGDDSPNALFKLEIKKRDNFSVGFHVEEVVGWEPSGEPALFDHYLDVVVKWDGCCHVNLGDQGYMHLCGKLSWINHCRIMETIYKMAGDLMTQFEPSQIWQNA